MSESPSGETAPPLDVLVVSHTHWDREWYRTAGEFRQLLVSLIDELLDEPGTTPFLLDGQAILLDDYLSVRPERAAELQVAFRDGRLEAGPWYVLADELIPSAEALVRNLLAGHHALRAIGATAPPVLYSPDSFGHPSALPELACGFGLTVAIVWRGYGGKRWPSGDAVRWRSPSGRETLLFHLPPDGYEFGASLASEPGAAHERWRHMHSVLAPRARLGRLLIMNGADHHARQRDLPEALRLLAEAANPHRVLACGLTHFAEGMTRRGAARTLPSVVGELRDSYGYAWTLGGTMATRAQQKRRNAKLERLLIRDVEPWVAYEAHRRVTSSPSLLDATWRQLLACHPHDSLCGCSSDEVAAEVEARFASVERDARFLRDRTIPVLLGHNADLARAHEAEWQTAVVLRNRAARARSGVAAIELDIPLAQVRVGPGSVGGAVAVTRPAALQLEGASPLQRLLCQRVHAREEAPRAYPRNALVERQQALVWVNDVPAYGLRVLRSGRARRGMVLPDVRARSSADSISNGVVSVGVVNNALVLSAGSNVVNGALGLESAGERGDLYTPSPIPGTGRTGSLERWRITARGPLRSELTTWWRVEVAARALTDATGVRIAHGKGTARLRVRIQVDAGCDFARFVVDGAWAHADASLRLRFATGLSGAATWADAMFGDAERRHLVVPAEDQQAEQVQHCAPLHRLVSRYTASRGATLVSDGLAEYEAADDGSIAVTLVRSTGDLSRADLPERPGHAGWPMSTPAAQCQGPLAAEFALALHGPRTPECVAGVHRMAEDVLLPLSGLSWRSAVDPPSGFAGVELDGNGLVASAIKPSEDRNWTVLRCLNLWDTDVAGCWRLNGLPASDAVLARLDETPLGALPVVENAVSFIAPPRAVVTILIR